MSTIHQPHTPRPTLSSGVTSSSAAQSQTVHFIEQESPALTDQGIFQAHANYQKMAFFPVRGEGTLVSDKEGERYMTSQYNNLVPADVSNSGRSRASLLFNMLLAESAADSRSVGFHMHPTELRGAILYDSALYGDDVFPPAIPEAFRAAGGVQGWESKGDVVGGSWRATGKPCEQGSAQRNKGWEGWHAYAKTYLPQFLGQGLTLGSSSQSGVPAATTPSELRAARLARFGGSGARPVDLTPSAPPLAGAPPIVLYETSEECVICLSAQAVAAPSPCGHRCACAACLDTMLEQAPSPQCPICRCPIYAYVLAGD